MAATFHAVVKNVDRLRTRLAKYNEDVRKGISRAISKGAIDIQRTAVASIHRGNPTGRTYKRGNVVHRASAPGEPPATDKNNLVKNILTAVEDHDDGNTIAYVYVTDRAPYGKWLEYGTTRIAPRPFLHPAFMAHRDAINAAIKAAFRGAKPKG